MAEKFFEMMNMKKQDCPGIIYQLDNAGKINYINDNVNSYGYDPEKLKGKSIFQLVHPEDKEKARYRLNERRTGKRKTSSFKVRLLTNNQQQNTSLKPYSNNRIFLLDAEGIYNSGKNKDFLGTIGIAKDISMFDLNYASSVEKNKMIIDILESLTHPLYIIDAENYEIKLANTAANFGNLSSNRKCYKVTHKRDVPCDGNSHPCPLQMIKASGKPVKVEHIHFDRAGKKRIFEIHGYPLFNDAGKVARIIEYSIDITEKKENERAIKLLEEELFQAQKMESIGRLSGGIAHDFNNILTGIMGYADILKINANDNVIGNSQELEEIIKLTERASNLTNQLLSFARKKKPKFSPIKIEDVLEDSFKVVEKSLNKNTEVIKDKSNEEMIITGDKNQLMQVFTNLFINANHAMPEGGSLKISSSSFEIDKKFHTRFTCLPPGEYVKIAVTDTGCGMSEDTIIKIFEPFFTTKGSEGTGLGLSIVYGIIKNHGGCINVFSKPEGGTTFEVYFERINEECVLESENKSLKSGKGTILVVDDEHDVRYSLDKLLTFLDYKIVATSSGEDALRMINDIRYPALIILDIIIPGTDTLDIFQKIRTINPEQKVLLISGYNKNGIVKKLLEKGANGFIQKPFTLPDISESIHNILSTDI